MDPARQGRGRRLPSDVYVIRYRVTTIKLKSKLLVRRQEVPFEERLLEGQAARHDTHQDPYFTHRL